MSVGKQQWLISPPCTGLTQSTFSFNPGSWEKAKKEKTPELGCHTPSSLPGTLIHTSVPFLQVWGHKLAARVDQGKTSCVLYYGTTTDFACSPWRICCTHITVVITVKISMDSQVQTESLLTLAVFYYPLIARHKPPCGRGKDRIFQ